MTTLTSAETNRAEWLAWRRGHCGGSDIAELFSHGFHGRLGQLHVYNDKLGLVPDREPDGNMRRGAANEESCRKEYEIATGRTILKPPGVVHPEYSFLGCSLDGLVMSEKDIPQMAAEFKSVNHAVYNDWEMHGLPTKVILQVTHNMLVSGHDKLAFAALHAEDFDKLLYFDIERDDSLCDMIINVAGEFWENHILKQVPPKMQKVVPIDVETVGGEMVTMDSEEWSVAVEALRNTYRMVKQAKELQDDAKGDMKLLMKAAGADRAEGCGVRISWKEQAGRPSFDKDLFAATHPDIDLEEFTTYGDPFHSFRPTFAKER